MQWFALIAPLIVGARLSIPSYIISYMSSIVASYMCD